MAGRRRGTVEAAVRKLVASLGPMSARQVVAAESAYTIAQRLDDEVDGAKSATLSRELRIVVATLQAAEAPAARAGVDEPGSDPVQRLQDELALKRAGRVGNS